MVQPSLLNKQLISHELLLEPIDNMRLADLCGPFDQNLIKIEKSTGVEINHRGHIFQIIGRQSAVIHTRILLEKFYQETGKQTLTASHFDLILNQSEAKPDSSVKAAENLAGLKIRSHIVKARTENQVAYLRSILDHAISFAIGPAGTGKTYLAVASAVQALESQRVQRLVLVRPAVEAGERLGFLPGDMAQKVDPYLRPLYDALYEIVGFDRVTRLIERGIIEIAPLAFMRGRSINDAFIILDEAQNTTVEQMKMFLTRMGFGSIAVIAGDVTQVDLQKNKVSGLKHVIQILKDVEGISFTHFQARDVVRHPLVQRIVQAYELDRGDVGAKNN